MFTVKHIDADGDEHIIPADKLNEDGDAIVYSRESASIWVAGRNELLRGGTVYVMNESGATVAKYELGLERWLHTEVKTAFEEYEKNPESGISSDEMAKLIKSGFKDVPKADVAR